MATALVLGNMIGSGVFLQPSSLAAAAGPVTLLGWGFTGAGAVLLALASPTSDGRSPPPTGRMPMRTGRSALHRLPDPDRDPVAQAERARAGRSRS